MLHAVPLACVGVRHGLSVRFVRKSQGSVFEVDRLVCLGDKASNIITTDPEGATVRRFLRNDQVCAVDGRTIASGGGLLCDDVCVCCGGDGCVGQYREEARSEVGQVVIVRVTAVSGCLVLTFTPEQSVVHPLPVPRCFRMGLFLL